MKKPFLYVAAFAVFVAAAFIATRHVQSQAQGRVPFTVTILERRYDGSGAEVYRENQLFGFRSDGSQVRILRRTLPDGKDYNIAWIVDVASGKSISIHPEIETTTTRPLSEKQLGSYRAPDGSCRNLAGAERKTILGYAVVRVFQKWPLQPGERAEIEEWKAPDLECFPLSQAITEWMPDGKALRTTRDANFVMPGQPSSELFDVPKSYVERSPSAMASEFGRKFPGHRVASVEVLSRADQRYFKANQP